MSDFTNTLKAYRKQYAYALRRYQAAPLQTKQRLSYWEMLRWATNALNVVLERTGQPLVELLPAPWALTEKEVFDLACESQRGGLSLLSKPKSRALAA